MRRAPRPFSAACCSPPEECDEARAARAETALAQLPRPSAPPRHDRVARALLALEQGDVTAARHAAAELLGADRQRDALVIALSVAISSKIMRRSTRS